MSITPSLIASRTSGVAPLYVHFDATGTRSTTESTEGAAFKNLHYVWDFGDTGAGTWAFGNSFVNDKNAAYGGTAAHVFETAGVYTVTLHVYDGTEDAFETVTEEITVANPNSVSELSGSNIILVSTDGSSDETNYPSATIVNTSDLSTALAALSTTKKRMLFKRGQTWTDSADLVTNNLAGRVIVGAWGSGDDPTWQYTGSTTTDAFVKYSGTALADWSFSDINVICSTQACFANQGSSDGNISKVLFLRVTATDSLHASEFAGDGIISEIGIVDCEIAGSYASYFAGTKCAVMGVNFLGDTGGVGTYRTQYFNKSVMQHCRMIGSAASFDLMRLAAPKSADGPAQYDGLYTELSILSDNDFDDRTGGAAWGVQTGPENGGQDERVRNCVFERNWFRSGTSGESQLMHFAALCAIRNNLFDLSNASTGANDQVTGPRIDKRGIEPDPDGNEVYNNSFYSSKNHNGGNNLNFVRISADGDANLVKNNLGYAPSTTTANLLSDGGTNTVANNNSSSVQVRGTDPGWTSPADPEDFQITGTSYAFEAGAAIKVFDDYFGRSRIGVTNDMGFYQLTEGEYPWEGAANEQTAGDRGGVPVMRMGGLLR